MDSRKLFTREDRERIEQAVAEVEKKTSAEIVCAVSSESGRYDRAEGIVGLGGALLGLGMAHVLQGSIMAGEGEWAAPLALGWQAFAVVAGFIAGTIMANKIPPLRRLATGEKEIEGALRRAASHTFHLGSVANTAGRTGLLIYVSLFERRVVILPDEKVRKALGNEEIERLRDLAVAALRRGDFASALVDPIMAAGPRLAEQLPAERSLNPNELLDHVLTFHPRPGAIS